MKAYIIRIFDGTEEMCMDIIHRETKQEAEAVAISSCIWLDGTSYEMVEIPEGGLEQ